MRDAGAWVFAAGLHPPETATVLRAAGDDVLPPTARTWRARSTSAGSTIIEAPDLDAALRLGTQAGPYPRRPAVEVRPFQSF